MRNTDNIEKRRRGSARRFGDRRSTESKSGTTGRRIERVTRGELHGNGRIRVSNVNGRTRTENQELEDEEKLRRSGRPTKERRSEKLRLGDGREWT